MTYIYSVQVGFLSKEGRWKLLLCRIFETTRFSGGKVQRLLSHTVVLSGTVSCVARRINLNAAPLSRHENPAGGPVLEAEGKIAALLRSVPPGTRFAALSPHQSGGIKREGETGLIWISWTSTTWEAAQFGSELALFNCSAWEASAWRLAAGSAKLSRIDGVSFTRDYFERLWTRDTFFNRRSSYRHNAAPSKHRSLGGDGCLKVVGSTPSQSHIRQQLN